MTSVTMEQRGMKKRKTQLCIQSAATQMLAKKVHEATDCSRSCIASVHPPAGRTDGRANVYRELRKQMRHATRVNKQVALYDAMVGYQSFLLPSMSFAC